MLPKKMRLQPSDHRRKGVAPIQQHSLSLTMKKQTYSVSQLALNRIGVQRIQLRCHFSTHRGGDGLARYNAIQLG